jgi:hypothetical protein
MQKLPRRQPVTYKLRLQRVASGKVLLCRLAACRMQMEPGWPPAECNFSEIRLACMRLAATFLVHLHAAAK